jgi:RNA polymerase sigma-70 factor (ECF subfamily)
VRLATLLVEHAIGDQPKTHALLALMLLNSARNKARVDDAGNLLRLHDQDRSRWDQAMVAQGMAHLARSASGLELTRYHLEAGIAACHCSAPDFASTDWQRILALYDRLVWLDNSPVVALNRAVVVANVQGPTAGIAAVESIRNRSQLDSYYLLYAVLGDLEARQLNFPAASGYFRQALELTQLESERRFLAQRVQFCTRSGNSSQAGTLVA